MNFILKLVDIFLHVDTYLSEIIGNYGGWTYALLFFIIFMETGFVVTPFLPGDSLLFTAGTFASPVLGSPLNIWFLYGLLSLAAVGGDTVNYWIGHAIGARAYTGEIKWIKKEYMDRTHAFFEKHGGKTIFLARFVPIIRTFAPFVAGVGRMSYGYFITWNLVGGVSWVTIFLFAGYFFGNIPFVQKNFEFVVIAIILISLVPVFVEAIKARRDLRKNVTGDAD